eukprot:GHVU01164064.1.p1 GENE.GHVU01164064.1~~GHVU01164064.1.p1  ORF type:complete len:865 (-),score=82.47 GHVU01164064.1:47-2434(-)
MAECGLSINQPVIVHRTWVGLAWPWTGSKDLVAVGILKDSLERLGLRNSQGIVCHRLPHSDVMAQRLYLQAREEKEFYKTPKFASFVKNHLSAAYITDGNTVALNYFGQPCQLTVSNITGADPVFEFNRVKQLKNLTSTPISRVPRRSPRTGDRDIVSNLAELSLDDSRDVECVTLDETGFADVLSPPKSVCVSKSTDSENISKEDSVDKLPHKSNFAGSVSFRDTVFYKVTNHTQVFVSSVKDMEESKMDKKVKKLSFQSIGGLDKALEEIREVINMHLDDSQGHRLRSTGLSLPRGILLYGPSGTGKSMIGQALANEFPANYVAISGPQIWSKYYGESEGRLSRFFKQAKERSPSIVFMDELDALCPRRDSSQTEVERRVVASLLTLMDDALSDDASIIVVGATNKRDDLDPALRRPGRLDREVEIGVPTAPQRAQILEKLLNGVEHSLIGSDIEEIARGAHGFVGADLAAVCKEAGMFALKRRERSGGDGKVALTLDDVVKAMQGVKPSAMREVTLEVPQVGWGDIGGQEDLKHKLRQAIEWPLKHPEAFQRLGVRPPRGLLMYGPPGCSKTMIAQALARESGINFIAIKGPELFSKWVGESERAVREVFRKARAAAPSIVFFDEIDAIAGERSSGSGGGGSDVSDRVLTQLLTEMDGVTSLKDVTIVAATNRPDRIDKALLRPGRLDRIVYVPLPDAPTRREIFQIHFRKTPVSESVTVDNLVNKTERYSGAEVSAVCREAALCAMQEDINIDSVHERHFQSALQVVKPRIGLDLITFYENYNKSSGLHTL